MGDAKRIVRRILVTGARTWTNAAAVREALLAHGPGLVLHGGARGLDSLAGAAAIDLGWPRPEVRRADWDRYGNRAGRIRNQVLVDLGADLCLAFPGLDSRGTYDCAARAERAGIRVVWVPDVGVTQRVIDVCLENARWRLEPLPERAA